MLILKRPWTRQPQGSIAGIDSRYGQALHWQVGALSLTPPSPVPGNSAQGLEVTPGGIGFATNLDLRGNRYGPTDSIPSALSIMVVVVLRSDTANRGLFGNWSNTSVTNRIQFVQTAGHGIRLTAHRGTAEAFFDVTLLPLGVPHVAIAITDGGSVDYWVNSTKRATLTGIGSGGLSGAGQFWQSGQYYSNDSGRWGNNTILASVVVNRAWSNSEALALSQNPWQLFAPRRIPIPTPAAAGYTHPTLSAATATEITATGFKPRVTYTFA